ncbi:MAG: sulfate adenylyltransferase subunit CysD [Alphaproteobacteria bacterium]|nr:sulfate adenylyltransferase subunit CysD [Alphaproteobacteria bacterium]
MDHLADLEARSVYILREAFHHIRPLAMLWSIGKDSSVLAWLAMKAFFGRVPFPAMHLDTDMEFDEVYRFRDRIAREWNLDLKVVKCPPVEATDASLPPAARSAARKTLGLANAIRDFQLKGIIAGIRRDEERLRAKERVFSPRDETGQWNFREQPPEFWDQFNTAPPEGAHLRIHPLLHWTEVDIWLYIKRESIPVVPLYFARDGRRYRTLGEKDITFPIESDAATIDEIIAELRATNVPERVGRAMDHESEDSFERLRAAGYM